MHSAENISVRDCFFFDALRCGIEQWREAILHGKVPKCIEILFEHLSDGNSLSCVENKTPVGGSTPIPRERATRIILGARCGDIASISVIRTKSSSVVL